LEVHSLIALNPRVAATMFFLKGLYVSLRRKDPESSSGGGARGLCHAEV